MNNGYVSLVRGHIRLNVGKYGSLEKVGTEIPDVNRTNVLSAAEHDSMPRESRGGFGGRPGGRPDGGGRSFGREERRIHGRRRF